MLNFDLFNGETPYPPMPSLIDSKHGFAVFWKLYAPGHARKVGRKECEAYWEKTALAGSATHIANYLIWIMGDWQKDGYKFVPQPIRFLRLAGWEEWDGIEAPKKPARDAELTRKDAEKAAWKPPSAQRIAELKALRAEIK